MSSQFLCNFFFWLNFICSSVEKKTMGSNHQNIHSWFPCKTEQHTNYVHIILMILKPTKRKNKNRLYRDRIASKCCNVSFDGTSLFFNQKFEYLCVCFICQTVFSTRDIRRTDNKTLFKCLPNQTREEKETEKPGKRMAHSHIHKNPNELKKYNNRT